MSRVIMLLLFLATSADRGLAQEGGQRGTQPSEAVVEPILWSTFGSLVAIGTTLVATDNDFEVGTWPSPLSEGAFPLVEAGAVAGTMGGGYIGARIRGHNPPGLASAISSTVAVYGLSLLLRDADNTMGSGPAILLFSATQGTAAVVGPRAWQWLVRKF